MNIRQVTAADCRRIAALLKRAIARHGLRCPAGSNLNTIINDCEWMGSFADDDPQPDVAHAADAERTLRAFPMFEQALRIANAVTWAENAKGLGERLRFLKSRFDRLQTQDAKSLDALFEVEIAGRLARVGLGVEFAEPDIVLSAGDVRVALACKRPRSETSIKDCVRDATHQIECQREHGVIIVGVEAIFHRVGERGVRQFQAETKDEFLAATQERLGQIVVKAAPNLKRAFESAQVGGVLFCGVVTAWSKQPSAYLYTWARSHVPNLNHPVPSLVGAVDTLMFGNLAEAA